MSDKPILIKNFLDYLLTIKGKSQGTVKEYFYDLRLFFRFLKLDRDIISKEIQLEEIDISDVDIEFIRSITLGDIYAFLSYTNQKRENKASSRARKVACIRSFFNYLYSKAKLLDSNPALDLESPKILKRLPKYLNIEESKKLLSSVDGEHRERNYAIITLFLNCGLRLSELVNINLSNIKNDTLVVVGKGGKERTIYLNAACQKALENYIKVRKTENVKDKNALFLSERNNRISVKTVQYIVKKHIIKSGFDPHKYSVHKLRHTAATLMYKHGNVDIRSLQEILGHESISTTEIYTHVDSGQLREAAEKNPLANTFIDED